MTCSFKCPKTTIAVVVLLAFLLILFCFSCLKSAKPGIGPETSHVVKVRTTEVQKADEREYHSFAGVAKSTQITDLAFRVAGKLEKLDVVLGRNVAKGEVIAKIDSRDYELAITKLETDLSALESALSAMKSGARIEDITALEAELSASEAVVTNTEVNFKRFEKLLKDQAVTEAIFDVRKMEYDVALAKREALKQQLEKARVGSRKEDIDSMLSKIEGLQVSLQLAKNTLEDTVLEAPYDGFIIEKFVENHEVVSPITKIVSFAKSDALEVVIGIPEEIVVRQNEISGYFCEFEAYPDRRFSATLKELGQATPWGKQTYPLIVLVELPGESDVRLFPGMTTKVTIEFTRKMVPLMVPHDALVGNPSDGSSILWRVDETTGTVKSHPVKILRLYNEGVEIEGDLEIGAKIVTAGARFLNENQSVSIEQKK